MRDKIFQASDLTGAKRREFLEVAKVGRAHLRYTDGTGIVALPERELELLEQIAYWSAELRRISSLIDSGEPITVVRLDRLAWLRVFERDDMRLFVEELEDALIAATADHNVGIIEEVEQAWRVTAAQLEDPLRREVLTSRFDSRNFRDAVEGESDGS